MQPEDQPQAASSSDRAASVQSRSLTAPLLTLGSRRTPNEDAELPPYDYEGPGEASTHHQEEEEGNPRLRIQPGLGRSTSMMERLLIGTPREVRMCVCCVHNSEPSVHVCCSVPYNARVQYCCSRSLFSTQQHKSVLP